MDQSICRACLIECLDEGEYISIYEFINIHENKEIQLFQILTDFTSIPCQKNDGMPNLLCKKCTMDIKTIYKFREKYLESYEVLKNMLKKYVNVDQQELLNADDTNNDNENVCMEEQLNKFEINLHDQPNGYVQNSHSYDNTDYNESEVITDKIPNDHNLPHTCDICGHVLKHWDSYRVSIQFNINYTLLKLLSKLIISKFLQKHFV